MILGPLQVNNAILFTYADDHHMYVVAQSVKMPRKASSILVQENFSFGQLRKVSAATLLL